MADASLCFLPISELKVPASHDGSRRSDQTEHQQDHEDRPEPVAAH